MKILKINIPTDEEFEGLAPIKMDKLGSIVLVAGKNGAGKTRILNKIFNTLSKKPRKNHIENVKQQLARVNGSLHSANQDISRLESQLLQTSPSTNVSDIQANIEKRKQDISSWKSQASDLETQINWNQIETSELLDKYRSVPFVPKNLNLEDCNTFPKKQIIDSAKGIDDIGVEHLPNGSFAKIQVIQDRWFNATHQNSHPTEAEKASAIEAYDKLTGLIEIFLNTKVDRSLDGLATLFGFPLGSSNLSDGQKVLIQFCMAIYSQETALKDLILILDEPENHLHPSVIIETLDRIQKCVSNGQIWIATHSIPLLAHYDPSLLWFVENGKIRHAGKIPEQVLNSLLGDENEIGRLQDFISLPAQFATSRHAFECLVEPPAVMTGSDDPQSHQIRKDLERLSKNGKLRILDYGAGQGRLISNIFDLELKDNHSLLESLDYIAYDKYDIFKKTCENSIAKVYGNSADRYFNDMGKLLSVYNKGSFGVVIMCNVLHEIDPKDWLKLFLKDGTISNLLADDGFLLLVEDHQMPIGEKAYQKGFLVLDTEHLKDLFKINESDKNFKYQEKSNGRLKAHQIPKECLIRIDEESRLAALKSLSITAREKILQIREADQNYHNGKLHGLWTQQFANAHLNLAELSSR